MREAQKQEILGLIDNLHHVHEEIKKSLEQNNLILAQDMISEAQQSAISLGEKIEKTEGEGHRTVTCLEEYCELLFCVYEDINKNDHNVNKIHKTLRKQLIKIENSVKNDTAVRKEIVFFPYKASMWDSLESIYLAAKADPDCDAYCVPIPYYTLNADHSLGQMHYEGNEYPENIEITDWQEYDFEKIKPDVIYIHNPYDDCNLVTSVHPRFYSSNLKKYTDTLVYVPYYVTSGGMLEAQGMLPAYQYVDYIVIQSPRFREYFDQNIPDEKFLPFGSPKVDKVIRKCQNPPVPLESWIEKVTDKEGKLKRVIFYNTGIAAMLKDTGTFLKKMTYVFKCFIGRDDVCLLWRPHPLLEATFDSMRPEFRPIYDALKKTFMENNLGIYDTTSDIEESIALSDAYIGDAGTSVIMLFGVAGKPIFILNNQILEDPKDGDWLKDFFIHFNGLEQGRFTIIQGSKLYISEPNQYDYKYFCDLGEDVCNNCYFNVYNIYGKLYACPCNDQDILVIGKNGVEKKITLERKVNDGMAFSLAFKADKYLVLLPIDYPAIVRYDTITEKISYFADNIDVFVKEKNGRKIRGGAVVYQGDLYIASPTDNLVYKLNIESGENTIIELPIKSRCGGNVLIEYDSEIWFTPFDGQVVVRWNPETNEVREYEGFPEGFICINPADGSECTEIPFAMPAFCGEYVYFPPCWSNMPLRLNINTGEFIRWIPPYQTKRDEKENFAFLQYQSEENESSFKVYSFTKQRLYNINLDRDIYQEMEIRFDIEELENNEPGFCKYSESLPYVCVENHFNTLSRFISNKTVGNQFCKKKQLAVYGENVVNYDGGCGKKVHEYIKKISR